MAGYRKLRRRRTLWEGSGMLLREREHKATQAAVQNYVGKLHHTSISPELSQRPMGDNVHPINTPFISSSRQQTATRNSICHRVTSIVPLPRFVVPGSSLTLYLQSDSHNFENTPNTMRFVSAYSSQAQIRRKASRYFTVDPHRQVS